MATDRRKLAAQWRRAMRKGDDESVSRVLDAVTYPTTKLTFGDLGAIGGGIRRLGMVRSALIALAFGFLVAILYFKGA